jgi:hypothetical protein
VTFYLVPIVEGQTEVGCVERLLQRVWTELLAPPDRLQVLLASRGKRDALINPDHPDFAVKIEEAYAKLARRLRHDSSSQSRGMLLLLLDAEKDCPAELGPRLLEAATRIRSDASIACVLAKEMLENWIVAGASTLAGVNDLPNPLPVRDKFEDRSGAAWLDDQLRRNSKSKSRKYKKTVDAGPFVRAMALQECRDNAPSFDKPCRELEARQQPPAQPGPTDDAAPPAEEGGISS